jgi:hypothetical protein
MKLKSKIIVIKKYANNSSETELLKKLIDHLLRQKERDLYASGSKTIQDRNLC